MNIVIIGCNGFIGSNFLHYYSSLGANILCVGRKRPKSFHHQFLDLDDFLSIDKKLELSEKYWEEVKQEIENL